MSTRPRRAAASKAGPAAPAASANDPDADPDFLALSARQRRAIDKAFERGLKAAGAGGRKRRKLNKGKAVDIAPNPGGAGGSENDAVGGGFIDEGDAAGGGFMNDGDTGGGGFMLDDDDDGGGGFVPDDGDDGGGGFMLDDGDDDMGGGFMQDETDPSNSASRTTTRTNTRPTTPAQNARVPLHVLPGLLGSLDLPTDDDVLAVFRASATGWDEEEENDTGAAQAESVRRRKRGEEDTSGKTGGSVGRKDFRAVCAALMGPDDQPDAGGGGGGDGDVVSSDDDASDTFELDEDEDESSLSDISSEGGTYGRPKAAGKGKTGGAKADTSATRRRERKNKALEEDERVKLSSRQKEMVSAIWAMIKPPKTGNGPQRGGMVLGRDELKVVVRDFGEMWTDEEITDMITLFSSQHEGRGLTFDDFGAVMLRAGLV